MSIFKADTKMDNIRNSWELVPFIILSVDLISFKDLTSYFSEISLLFISNVPFPTTLTSPTNFR